MPMRPVSRGGLVAGTLLFVLLPRQGVLRSAMPAEFRPGHRASALGTRRPTRGADKFVLDNYRVSVILCLS